jgi:lipopolysaccharide biosynthesis protein
MDSVASTASASACNAAYALPGDLATPSNSALPPIATAAAGTEQRPAWVDKLIETTLSNNARLKENNHRLKTHTAEIQRLVQTVETLDDVIARLCTE